MVLVDDLSDPVVLHRDVGRLGPGVAQEAFLLLEMGHDTVALGPHRAARGRRFEAVFATDQQIARRRVATALLARMNTMDGPMWYCPVVGCPGVRFRVGVQHN